MWIPDGYDMIPCGYCMDTMWIYVIPYGYYLDTIWILYVYTVDMVWIMDTMLV